MSIRVTALYVVVTGLCIYAWKDWFKSLCGLILLMAVIEHEDMPKNLFGIQGFNAWNILFLVIFLAWLSSRRREGLTSDMPRHIIVLLLMYLGVVLVGVLRAILDRSYIEHYPLMSLVSDYIINSIKWVLPGLLLFDGCRTRKRTVMALVCILAMYFVISILVLRRMPIEAAFSYSESIHLTRSKLSRSIGYNACDVSAFLAGVSWAILAALPLLRKKKYWVMLLPAAGVVVFAQALSGGRAGYLAWGATGLTLCLLKWRKLLLLAPVAIILLPIIFPGPVERMLEGFGQTSVTGEAEIDEHSVTSGRSVAWPLVIDKIGESPVIGHGRLAMRRTGLTDRLMSNLNESFPHPHNMYLETLLDNGVLGSLPIFLFWGIVLFYSARLFRSDNCLYAAVGGLALSLTLAQLFAGIGAQHYYPKESTLGLWAAVSLVLRVHVEEMQAQTNRFESEGIQTRVFSVWQSAVSGSVHP
jgi:hypothetical protein